MRYISLITLVVLMACSSTKNILVKENTDNPKNISLNGKLFAALFQQRAAEYRALCFQGYNMAKQQIDNFQPKTTKPKAIITDIDETILDNSAYAVHQGSKGKEYEPESWYQWTDMALADTMPGATTFLNYAASKGIQVFYITNREERERESTLRNLQKFNLPNADNQHLKLKTTTSGKEQRRQDVMKDFEVILLMGDNLADFSSMFDKKAEQERRKNTDILSNLFGNKFIMFPNSSYGDWEGSLYKNNYKLTQSQKDSILMSILKNY